MMGWLKLRMWWSDEPVDGAGTKSVSKKEFEDSKQEFDQRMSELEDLIHAVKGDEPDLREPPHDVP